MRQLNVIAGTALLCCFLSSSSAGSLAGISISQTPFTPGGGVAHTVNDINITFSGMLTTQELVISLTSGSIYQNAFGGTVPPTAAIVGLVPDAAFDSFVALDTLVGPTAALTPGIAGGATDLGGGSAAVFGTTSVDISWFPPGGTTIASGTDFTAARITLSNDASGTWKFVSTTATGNGYVAGSPPTLVGPNVNFGIGMDGTISGGVISIPEPSSWAMCFVALFFGFVPKFKNLVGSGPKS